MRFPKIQALVALFVLVFSATLFAQAAAELTADQIAALDGAATPAELNTVLQQMIADGAAPAAVATALSQRGQTPAQITTALVNANVTPAAATVAVRVAVPSATNAQLSQGLAAAGVAADAASVAVNQAPAATAPVATTAAPVAVAAITSSGLLIGADGKAVVVVDEADQIKQVLAFVTQQSKNNPDMLNDPATQQGLSSILGNALSSSSSGAVSSEDAGAAVLTQLIAAAAAGGGADVLGDALDNAVAQIEEENDVIIVIPDVGSPS